MINCLFFGDSITYGEYDGIYGGWVDILKRDFHLKFYKDEFQEINIYNLGIGGDTSGALLKRLQTELTARKSPVENFVFFFYGANDSAYLNGLPITAEKLFIQNLESAIQISKTITSKIFFISIIPISDTIDGQTSASGKIRTNERILYFNSLIEKLTQKNHLTFINIHERFFSQKEQLLSKDGIHPNESGYKFIADLIKPVIKQHLQ